MAWDEIQLWELLAGLGLFLFGMYMLEEALKVLAGRSFKTFLRKHTENRVKAVLAGATVTAILQSSSMVVLLVMSFAGAGIIGLGNGIGMVLGANLGTTATGWIVTFLGFKMDIKQMIFPFLAIGGLGLIFLKSDRLANFSKLMMGFSFMFLGLSFMKDGFEEFVQHADLQWLQGKPMILFLVTGFILVALIQSSSAGIMIFLASLSSGLITFEQSLYLVIGGDLGTAMTAVLGTINAATIKKKVGWSQFYINVINGIVAVTLMGMHVYIIQTIFGIKDPLIGMVAFHSLMNLATIILLLPFINIFKRIIDKYITSKTISHAEYIHKTNPEESNSATEALEKEAIRFIEQSVLTNKAFFDLPIGKNQPGPNTMYNNLQIYESELVRFYNKVQQNRLSESEVARINNSVVSIRYATHSAKDIKDIKHNLLELRNASSDEFYFFYQKIHNNQNEFYLQILDILKQLKSANQSKLKDLLELQRNVLDHESDDIYSLFGISTENEMNISSLLNMVREINNSNREMIRAMAGFVNEKS